MRRSWLLIILAGVLVVGAVSFAMLHAGDDAEQTAGSTPEETVSPEDSASPSADESSPTGEEATASQHAGQSERESIAIEVARIMTTWDPQEDTTATAAEKRAVEYMTEERAEQVVAPQRPTTGEQWLRAAEENATSEPQVEILRGTETGTIAVEASWTWLTDDGHVVSQSEQRRIYHFTFTEGDDPKVSDYTWEQRQD